MILGSVRISKKVKLQGSLIHNFVSDKHKTNDNKNELFEVNEKGQVRKRTFERNKNNWGMYEETRKNFERNFDKVKEDYEKNNNRKLRKDSNLFFEGVITFGSSNNEDFDKFIRGIENKEEFNNKVLKSINEMLKENNIQGGFNLVKHRDEKSLHFHFDFIPYDWENHKTINKEFSPMYLSKIQDILYKNLKEFNIQRGIKKKDKIRDYCKENKINFEDLDSQEKIDLYKKVNVKNKSLKEFYDNIDKETKQKENQKNLFEGQIQVKRDKNEKLKNIYLKNREIIDKQEKEIKNQIKTIQQQQQEIKENKKIISQQEIKKSDKSNQLDILNKELRGLKEEVKELKEKLKTITKEKEILLKKFELEHSYKMKYFKDNEELQNQLSFKNSRITELQNELKEERGKNLELSKITKLLTPKEKEILKDREKEIKNQQNNNRQR